MLYFVLDLDKGAEECGSIGVTSSVLMLPSTMEKQFKHVEVGIP